jgi:hypothetical protein
VSYIGAEPTTAAFPFDQFSGNGTTTAFTLTYAPASTTSIIVAISGVVQNPNLYSVIGTTITFSPAPPTGTNNISVLYLGLPVQIGTPIPGSRLELALGSAANPSLTFLGDTNTGIFSPAADTIAFSEGGVEALRINSSGTVVLSGGDTTANGTGITFPATQSASSNANTLDDYEEGTFTATLSPGTSGSITLNSTFNELSYTKIGRLVTIIGQLAISSVSSPVGSVVNLNSLPFPCADTGELSERAGGCATYLDDSANTAYTQGMLIVAGDTFTRIYMTESGRVAAIAANDGFVFSFSYIAAT